MKFIALSLTVILSLLCVSCSNANTTITVGDSREATIKALQKLKAEDIGAHAQVMTPEGATGYPPEFQWRIESHGVRLETSFKDGVLNKLVKTAYSATKEISANSSIELRSITFGKNKAVQIQKK